MLNKDDNQCIKSVSGCMEYQRNGHVHTQILCSQKQRIVKWNKQITLFIKYEMHVCCNLA